MMTTLLPDFTASSSFTSFAVSVVVTPVHRLAFTFHSFSSRMESPAE
ncbi:hypothetical protein [Citrobacter sp. Cm046]|nr:hypothetical protein [Citrobacter sp. Cm046]MCQ7057479.1 hypothetical protein [Escherichia coli]MDM2927647.1 hypothetical protein [Citrobacter sp. Cm046]